VFAKLAACSVVTALLAVGCAAEEKPVRPPITDEQLGKYCNAICARRSELGCQSIMCGSFCRLRPVDGRCPNDEYARLIQCQAEHLDVIYKDCVTSPNPNPCAEEQAAYDRCK